METNPEEKTAIYVISIITQVIIEILALSLAENGVIFCYIYWKKSNEVYPLSIRVQTTKPHFDLFLPGMNIKENVFFLRARVQKGIA